MRRSFFEILKSFFASKEISAEIHRKNRETVVKIFWFSIIFALLEFAARIFFGLPLTQKFALYYGYYLLAGIIGLILCKTPSGKYTPIIFCLSAFYAKRLSASGSVITLGVPEIKKGRCSP